MPAGLTVEIFAAFVQQPAITAAIAAIGLIALVIEIWLYTRLRKLPKDDPAVLSVVYPMAAAGTAFSFSFVALALGYGLY